MTQPILVYAPPPRHEVRAKFWTLMGRVLCAVFGIVVPIAEFGMAASLDRNLGPEWQSGRIGDRFSIALWGSVGWPMYFFTAPAVVAMLVAIISPRLVARIVPLRWALYSGVPHAFVYQLVLGIVVSQPSQEMLAPAWALLAGATILATAGLLAAFAWLQSPAKVKRVSKTSITIAIVVGIGAIILAAVTCGPSSLLFLLLFVPLVGAPMLAMTVFTGMSIGVYRHPDKTPLPRWISPLVWVGWLGGYALTWQLVAERAIAAYHTLPTAAPSCFIATAAARGHRRLTGAQPVAFADHTLVLVTCQLRTFKCFEIVLAALLPRTHRLFRRVYNSVGPCLARRLGHPLAASAAYCAIKPAEIAAQLFLQLVLEHPAAAIARFYRADVPE